MRTGVQRVRSAWFPSPASDAVPYAPAQYLWPSWSRSLKRKPGPSVRRCFSQNVRTASTACRRRSFSFFAHNRFFSGDSFERAFHDFFGRSAKTPFRLIGRTGIAGAAQNLTGPWISRVALRLRAKEVHLHVKGSSPLPYTASQVGDVAIHYRRIVNQGVPDQHESSVSRSRNNTQCGTVDRAGKR
jgi:hypothetical protein